jgi:hypothetical protein
MANELSARFDRVTWLREPVQPRIHEQVVADGEPLPETGSFRQEADAAAEPRRILRESVSVPTRTMT